MDKLSGKAKSKQIRRINDQEKKAKKKLRKEAIKRANKAEKEYVQFSQGNEERVLRKRRLNVLETLILIVLSLVLVLLLCNKTFFREQYKTEKVDIDIPLLYYFTEDDGNSVTFKTLRKSDYDREFFEDYLDSLDLYNCNNLTFYYDKEKNTTIYSVDVVKDFAIKTITVNYADEGPATLCED